MKPNLQESSLTQESPPRPNLKEKPLQVKCADCKGTGHENHDCKACDGYGDMKLRRAYALGYKKDELEIEEDGWCRCPRCGGGRGAGAWLHPLVLHVHGGRNLPHSCR